jgi:hypothetical protein
MTVSDDLEEPGEGQPDEYESSDLEELRDKLRPEGLYDPADKAWLEPVVEKAKQLIEADDIDKAVESLARRRVYDAELRDTGAAKRYLREIGNAKRSKQLPLWDHKSEWWREILSEQLLTKPIAFEHRIVKPDGSVGTIRVRIKLGLASTEDLDEWSRTSSSESDRQQVADAERRGGASVTRDLMFAHKMNQVAQLRPEDPPEGK